MVDKTITRDGVQVEAGQRWRDLDRRMKGRIVTIVYVDAMNGLAHYLARTAKSRLSIVRMRRPYWELVTEGSENG